MKLLAVLVASLSVTSAWLSPIVTKGNKFFDADTGLEFRMKGMAYYPRPNAGELADVNNYDWAADEYEDVWKPHLKVMKDLGVNTIRLYAVDPSKPHDKFMCACSEMGMYVLVGVAAACENCAIQDAKPPKCYPDELLTRAQMIYNAFAVYDNTLGFSVGNENNLQTKYGKDGTTTAPCVKAFLRDVRNYASYCAGSMRQVPIGLDIADIPPREQWLQYYDCAMDENEDTRAEWIGFNPYVECDPKTNKFYNQSAGLQKLMEEYAETGYSRPLMFGEYGCNIGENTIDGYENQRGFYDAKWMNEEPEMMAEIVGGNVFEFSTEVANLLNGKKLTKKADPGKYGIGYFAPDDCDNDKVLCEFKPYPEAVNLKKAYTTTKPSTLTKDKFVPKRDKILTCPKTISTDLPSTPEVEVLACSVAQPKCNGKKSNAHDKDASQATKMGEKKTPTNAAKDDVKPLDGNEKEESSAMRCTTGWMMTIVLGLALTLA